MKHLSVKEWAESHGVSERTARNYCALGKIDGAYLVGKTWNIPAEAKLHKYKKLSSVSPLLSALREQKASKTTGGIYHRVQIDLTYNSNHMEGSRLTHDQTRYIIETGNTTKLGQVGNTSQVGNPNLGKGDSVGSVEFNTLWYEL